MSWGTRGVCLPEPVDYIGVGATGVLVIVFRHYCGILRLEYERRSYSGLERGGKESGLRLRAWNSLIQPVMLSWGAQTVDPLRRRDTRSSSRVEGQ
jgi:hypothetical protein